MDPQIILATEFLLRLPRRTKPLAEVLEAAAVVGGKILASCTHPRKEEDHHHVVVADDFLYEPHFRSTYPKAVEKRPILVFVAGADAADPFESLMEIAAGAGGGVEYCYGAGGNAEQRIAVRAKNHDAAYEALTRAASPSE